MVKSSSFSESSPTKPPSLGINAPRMNAPKIAWMPIHWVARALASSSTTTIANRFCDIMPRLAYTSAKRRSSGRTASTMKTTNATTQATIAMPSRAP